MSGVYSLMIGGVAERVGWALVHSVWQGLAVAICFWLCNQLLRRRSPNSRYVAGCLALVVMAAAPLATFLLVRVPGSFDGSSNAGAEFVAVQHSVSTDPGQPTISPVGPATRERGGVVLGDEVRKPAMAVGGEDSSPSTLLRVSSWCEANLRLFVVVWLCGVVVFTIRLVMGWFGVVKLRRLGVKAVGVEWRERAAELGKRLGVVRSVEVLESAIAQVPAVIGWLRPVVLLPASALTNLPPAYLETLLAHELAHVRRHDYLLNLLQTVLETMLYYHPAVWWVSHRIRMERERCCDDMAVAACGNAVEYARALMELEAMREDAPRLAAAATHGSLLDRIQRLVVSPNTDVSRGSGWSVGAMVSAVCLALAVGGLMSPLAQAGDGSDEEIVVVVDNSDAGVEFVGDWPIRTAAKEKYGQDYRFAKLGDGKLTATYVPDLPKAGYYAVYGWWSAGANRNRAAEYIVRHRDGEAVIYCNQNTGGAEWHRLGAAYFDAGRDGAIVVTNSGFCSSWSVTIADAVKWELIAGAEENGLEAEFEEYIGEQTTATGGMLQGQVQLEFMTVAAASRAPIGGAWLMMRTERGEPELQTNSEGRGSVVVDREDLERLRVNVRADGFVPMFVDYGKEQLLGDGPLVLALEKGVTIGGVVVDENGEGIDDVTVYLSTARFPAGESSVYYLQGHPVSTDEEGRWQCDVAPATASEFEIRAVHPEYVLEGTSEDEELSLPAEQFRDQSSRLVMRKGVTVTGWVLDADGHPISDAVVSQGMYYWGADYEETVTDNQGRYCFRNARPGDLVLTVKAEGWAPDMKRVRVERRMPSVDFKLGTSGKVRAQIMDQTGNPVSRARLEIDTWRGLRTLSKQAYSDESGRVELADVPSDDVVWKVSKNGCRTLQTSVLRPGAGEQVLTLSRTPVVSGRVLDARTGELVPEFELTSGVRYETGHYAWYLVAKKYGGFYEWNRFDDRGRLNAIRVEAEGYSGVTQIIEDVGADQVVNFALEPSGEEE